MTHIDHLLAQAQGHWGNHAPLPLDLFYKMLGEGIDVDAAERNFFKQQEQE